MKVSRSDLRRFIKHVTINESSVAGTAALPGDFVILSKNGNVVRSPYTQPGIGDKLSKKSTKTLFKRNAPSNIKGVYRVIGHEGGEAILARCNAQTGHISKTALKQAVRVPANAVNKSSILYMAGKRGTHFKMAAEGGTKIIQSAGTAGKVSFSLVPSSTPAGAGTGWTKGSTLVDDAVKFLKGKGMPTLDPKDLDALNRIIQKNPGLRKLMAEAIARFGPQEGRALAQAFAWQGMQLGKAGSPLVHQAFTGAAKGGALIPKGPPPKVPGMTSGQKLLPMMDDAAKAGFKLPGLIQGGLALGSMQSAINVSKFIVGATPLGIALTILTTTVSVLETFKADVDTFEGKFKSIVKSQNDLISDFKAINWDDPFGPGTGLDFYDDEDFAEWADENGFPGAPPRALNPQNQEGTNLKALALALMVRQIDNTRRGSPALSGNEEILLQRLKRMMDQGYLDPSAWWGRAKELHNQLIKAEDEAIQSALAGVVDLSQGAGGEGAAEDDGKLDLPPEQGADASVKTEDPAGGGTPPAGGTQQGSSTFSRPASMPNDWQTYMASAKSKKDKLNTEQIYQLWRGGDSETGGVAEKLGKDKSFMSWARWYNGIRKTGKSGIPGVELKVPETGKLIFGDREWTPGKHLSPMAIRMIMTKIYRGEPMQLSEAKLRKIIRTNIVKVLKEAKLPSWANRDAQRQIQQAMIEKLGIQDNAEEINKALGVKTGKPDGKIGPSTLETWKNLTGSEDFSNEGSLEDALTMIQNAETKGSDASVKTDDVTAQAAETTGDASSETQEPEIDPAEEAKKRKLERLYKSYEAIQKKKWEFVKGSHELSPENIFWKTLGPPFVGETGKAGPFAEMGENFTDDAMVMRGLKKAASLLAKFESTVLRLEDKEENVEDQLEDLGIKCTDDDRPGHNGLLVWDDDNSRTRYCKWTKMVPYLHFKAAATKYDSYYGHGLGTWNTKGYHDKVAADSYDYNEKYKNVRDYFDEALYDSELDEVDEAFELIASNVFDWL